MSKRYDLRMLDVPVAKRVKKSGSVFAQVRNQFGIAGEFIAIFLFFACQQVIELDDIVNVMTMGNVLVSNVTILSIIQFLCNLKAMEPRLDVDELEFLVPTATYDDVGF